MKISVQPGMLTDLFSLEECYRMIKEAGFDGIDWNLDHAWNAREIVKGLDSDCVFEEDMPAIRAHYAPELAAIGKYGLKIYQAHAPFPCFVKGFPKVRARVPKIYENCLRLCQEAGVPYLVIHGISREYDGSDMTREEMIQQNIDLYAPMIPTIKETGVMVLLENLFWDHGDKNYDATCSDPKEAVELIDKLNTLAGQECFGLCFDVGHCNLLSYDMATYLRTLGNRIKALHMHDNDGRGDWHRMPCAAGTVDWNELCALLKEISYEGALNFETFCFYDLKRTMPSVIPILLQTLAAIGKEFSKAMELA